MVGNTPITITYTATYTITHTLTNTGWKTVEKTKTITQPETTTVTVVQTVEAPIVPPELAETFKIAVIALAVLGGIALMIFGVRAAGARSRARGRAGGGRR
jgi:carbohydrate-binding DOMON domain-containing protein